ncbi:ATP-binding cassette domain-containing protein [Ramlibacter sp. G-1-2-2]|uniref:ATP-binding cassette domain-containing protein n=1 Tax=Ramlibacter agri TaxID=2728837 RepID=A0A848HG30_9BURK|nr:ABC transporter ATP-binding protein [Ramlibacter agri]NML46598.1 ATP-binding cassette domain-containing protein [Ramlibacter agri]
MAAVLSCRDVSKRYGRTQALDKVSLQVDEGEMVALLGPNGAGKTTLFQLLTGLFVPDSGSVEVLGADMRRNPVAALAHLGVVFQQPALDLNLTVRRSLRFHADLHGLPSSVSRPRIEALLQRFGLAASAGELGRKLSGGNRRKVELLRALLHEPRLLLMDEATVGLDPASRVQLLQEVLQAREERSIGVLWATHLVDEAQRAQRVIVLHKGTVRFDGTPQALCAAQGQETLEAAFLQLTGGERHAKAA